MDAFETIMGLDYAPDTDLDPLSVIYGSKGIGVNVAIAL